MASLSLSLPTIGYRIEDLHPVALLRIFYLAASLLVSRHHSAAAATSLISPAY
jgi:3-oxo-5-alpha-steroid 4-dehydrogenase 3